MNNKDLMYFCKLIDTGNYSTVARQCGVTQPTISLAIQRLSKEFDDPLIKQKNRKSKIYLTPAGKMLYQKGMHILKEISSMDYDVKHVGDRKIRLAFSGEAGTKLLPDIIKEFVDNGIISMLEPRLERSADAFEDLTNGDVDVALFSWMVPFNDPNYFLRSLGRTELVIVTSLNDPWKDINEIDARQLRYRKFIARESGYLTRECLDKVAQTGDFKPNIIFTANTMKLMLDLVERNVGIALAMKNSLYRYAHPEKYHIIHLKSDQRLYAYGQIGMRKSFIPNKYQRKGIEIFRNFRKPF